MAMLNNQGVYFTKQELNECLRFTSFAPWRIGDSLQQITKYPRRGLIGCFLPQDCAGKHRLISGAQDGEGTPEGM